MTAPAPAESIHAVTFSPDGATLYYAIGADQCIVKRLEVGTRDSWDLRALQFCPERLTAFIDGSLLAATSTDSAWILPDGSDRLVGRTVLAALDAGHFLERTNEGFLWKTGETAVALDDVSLRAAGIVAGGTILGIEVLPDGERLVRFDGPGGTAITPTFADIDSWDAAPKGDEVVFSARRESGFDVGIVSASGGEIKWVAPDPLDERNVTWAPRGNKITYTLESLDATLVRSVHVPTSFQVVFDLPLTTVRRIAWEPRAERIAIVVESPVSGPSIDWVGYQGDGRATLVEATETVSSPVETLLWSEGAGVLLGPGSVRYGESRPTVLWIDRETRFAWRGDAARLRDAGVPVLFVEPDRLGNPVDALGELPWHDPGQVYVVNVSSRPGESPVVLEGGTSFVRQRINASSDVGVELIGGDDAVFRSIVVQRILAKEGAGR
jgi:hypothetical protein